jgi:hypothetical protein
MMPGGTASRALQTARDVLKQTRERHTHIAREVAKERADALAIAKEKERERR